jgi:hypothetical protein
LLRAALAAFTAAALFVRPHLEFTFARFSRQFFARFRSTPPVVEASAHHFGWWCAEKFLQNFNFARTLYLIYIGVAANFSPALF